MAMTGGRVLLAVLCGGLLALSACSFIYAADFDHSRDAVPAVPEAGVGAIEGGCAALQPVPAYCNDFDKGALADGWSSIVHSPNAAGQILELVSDDSYSAPRALRASLTGAPACSYNRVERIFADAGTQRFELRVRLRPLDPFDSLGAVEIRFSEGATSCTNVLLLEPARTRVRTQRPANDNDVRNVAGLARPNQWTEFRAIATPKDTGISIRYVIVDAAGELGTTQDYPDCKLDGTAMVAIGLGCQSGNKAVLYDDVRVDWQ